MSHQSPPGDSPEMSSTGPVKETLGVPLREAAGNASPAGALSHEPSQRSIDVIVPVDLVVPVGLYCTEKLQNIFYSRSTDLICFF